MGDRINKALGYGLRFSSYDEMLDAFTDEFRELQSKQMWDIGVPFQKYLKWMMDSPNIVNGNKETNFVMDNLLSDEGEASKLCLRDLVNIIEFDAEGESGDVGFLIKPIQVATSRDWHRVDDMIDYYSHPNMSASWVESDYSFYPYDSNNRVSKTTGERILTSNSEYLYAKEKGLNFDEVGWEDSVPETPAVLKDLIEALNVFKDKGLILSPVIAIWWE